MVKGLTLALLIALAGCTTTKGSFCALESPIRLSAAAIAALSDAEVRGILAHNRTGQKLCGWKP
ncbi:hypothetical protein FJ959_09895 [Mesorhizobium sp. B2-2-4]|uniref:hypothetical protein n=1 Tax=unclassified Mesorhizobium TaxID=325217 RepID=UPI00112BD60F|nr:MULTISPECIES: hypothetical protein [unclassified Mesorhizobium]TPM59171.1 hypothetical protein FJ959_09895 [Mesorhizobium sp. B2-2-4]TPM67656.1 hypothetical protein FJ965_11035 [Mesorhizobium sp. B2-2-1]TPN66937.1 hypothetical protein FJ984_15895 [Mesorhizobium sp. B1-1-3]